MSSTAVLKVAPSRWGTSLYRHFDANGVLLYVGISMNPFTRTVAHMSRSHWVNDVTTITIERFTSRKAALQAEERAINSERPLHNILGWTNVLDPEIDDAAEMAKIERWFDRQKADQWGPDADC